jgi:hypothetical protein
MPAKRESDCAWQMTFRCQIRDAALWRSGGQLRTFAAMDTTTEQQADRVRRHTSTSARQEIDARTRRNVRQHALRLSELGQRLRELENEWDVERTLEANASTLAFSGAILGTAVNKKWFALTAAVLGFLFQHATSGWCPPLPILRKLGLRTRGEIDQEKFALKAIRGDFGHDAGQSPSAEKALQAVRDDGTDAASNGRREPDRVRRYTSRAQLRRIDEAMERRVRLYASQPREVISERIAELRREWSIERYLQINVAAVGLTATTLAVTRNRKWGFVASAGLALFMFHAIEGFDPPMPALRQMGIRSRGEIDREIYALKILRGDFDDVSAMDEAGRIEAALTAVGI